MRRLINLTGALLALVAVGAGVASAQEPATGGTTVAVADVPVYGFEVVAEYPHDPSAFTQGLDFVDGVLYEGTGQRGESTLRRVDLATGEVLQSVALAPEEFGEGITVVGDRIFQITWQEETAYVYDRATFELLETFTYATEGWGITSDGERLIMSDGTRRLTFRDPESFEALNRVGVRYRGQPLPYLNELEYIDGEVWANVWQTDYIVRIDPATGEVTGLVNLTGLLSEEDRLGRQVDVLNGIAHDPATGRLFVTGKYWPTLFEIELVPTG